MPAENEQANRGPSAHPNHVCISSVSCLRQSKAKIILQTTFRSVLQVADDQRLSSPSHKSRRSQASRSATTAHTHRNIAPRHVLTCLWGPSLSNPAVGISERRPLPRHRALGILECSANLSRKDDGSHNVANRYNRQLSAKTLLCRERCRSNSTVQGTGSVGNLNDASIRRRTLSKLAVFDTQFERKSNPNCCRFRRT